MSTHNYLFRHQSASINMVRMHPEIPYIFLIGGFGCLADDCTITTPKGEVKIQDFKGGEVLDDKGKIRIASQPIPCTSHLVEIEVGEQKILTSDVHLLLTLSGKYLPTATLLVQQGLCKSLSSLLQTSSDGAPLVQSQDVLRCLQILLDSLSDYLRCFHFDDEQLHLLLEDDLDETPLLEYAHIHNHTYYEEGGREILRASIHLRRVCNHLLNDKDYLSESSSPMLRSADLVDRLEEVVSHYPEVCADRLFAERVSSWIAELLLCLKYAFPCLLTPLLDSRIHSCMPSFTSLLKRLGYLNIISKPPYSVKGIKFHSYKGRVWKISVEGSHTYQGMGLYHHNCGKSYTDVQLCLFLYQIYHNSPTPIQIGVFGVTIKLLKQTVIADLERAFDSAGIPYRDNSQAGTLTVGSITFVYLAMQYPDDIYAFNFTCCLVDEIDELPPEKVKAVVKAVQERNRVRMPAPLDRDPFVFFSTTAQGMGGTYNLVKQFDKTGVPYAIIRGRTEDNTSLARSQIELLRKLYTPDEAKAYLDGEFVNLAQGRVYYAFERKQHMCMRFPVQDSDTIYVGQDFNYGFNASAEVICRGDTMYIVDSHHWLDMGKGMQQLREIYPKNRIVMIPDASGKEIMQGWIEEANQYGIELLWNNRNASITERIMAVNKAFTLGQLKVMEPYNATTASMRGLELKDSLLDKLILGLETRDFDDSGKPRKGKGPEALDHGCFAKGTLITTLRGEIPIETVKVGDKVLSHDGKWHEVYWAGCTGNKKVITRFGLTATPDHPLWVHNRKIALTDAKEYTMLNMEDVAWLRSLNSMASSIAGTKTDLEQKEITIMQALERANEVTQRYIEMCGNSIRVRYLKGITFIIKMVTSTIMIYRIWSVCLLLSMLEGIMRRQNIELFRQRLMLMLQPGIEAKKAISGTSEIAKNGSDNVPCAIDNMLQQPATLLDAYLKKEDSSAHEVAVHGTIAMSEQDVYNLSVTSSHTFFANGRLVHNCDAAEYSTWHILHTLNGFDKILQVLKGVNFHNYT